MPLERFPIERVRFRERLPRLSPKYDFHSAAHGRAECSRDVACELGLERGVMRRCGGQNFATGCSRVGRTEYIQFMEQALVWLK